MQSITIIHGCTKTNANVITNEVGSIQDVKAVAKIVALSNKTQEVELALVA